MLITWSSLKMSRYIEDYLNRNDVRRKIGVDEQFGNFSTISERVNQAFWITGDTLHETNLYVAELLARGIDVLIYAGTYDFVCNWVGNEEWTLRMEWSGQKGFNAEPLRNWIVDGEPAGLYRRYKNLVFATVFGAGHMVEVYFFRISERSHLTPSLQVPMDKPKEALAMLNRWLEGKNVI